VRDRLDAISAGGDITASAGPLSCRPLIDVEAIDAERYEHSDSRTTWRNGRSD